MAEAEEDRLMTAAEVAPLFRVVPETVAKWARKGLFRPGTVVPTPGGRRRYRESEVRRLLASKGGNSS